jgi:hypothetical protein
VLADHYGIIATFYFLAATIVVANMFIFFTPPSPAEQELAGALNGSAGGRRPFGACDPLQATTRSRPSDSMLSTFAAGRGADQKYRQP